MSILAMEWGFRAHEKGMNLEMAMAEFRKLMPDQPELIPAEPKLPRYDDRFTEADQQAMFEGALEEGSDLGRKEIAQLVMDGWDLCSCVAACSILNGEHICEPLARMLQHIGNQDENEYVNGEFLRLHDDGEDDYPAMLDFAKRMKLINEEETELTELGREYADSLA